MARELNRRQVLKRGLAAAGFMAGCRVHSGLDTKERGAGQKPKDRTEKAPTAPVAVQRCESFEPKLLRKKFDAVLDLSGGIKKLVRNKTVTVKVNLTGMSWKPLGGMPAYETYQTHPNTVSALCAALDDAGCRRVVIVENLYWRMPFEERVSKLGWDVSAIKSAGAHKVLFEDIRNNGRWSGYSRFKVPWGGFIYPAFDLNKRFEKTDVLISLSKLKEHACAGVTMTAKNMFGATPCALYGNDAPGEGLRHRTRMFHAGRKKVPDGVPPELDNEFPRNSKYRIPRIVSDIYGACPVDFTIIDGIRTCRGGEGHWSRGVSPIEPKVLLAGRNGVCADAVGTAVMGFDPQAEHMKSPFPGENHLRILASAGVGTNDLEKIEVRGLSIKEALCRFQKGKSGS